MPTQRTTPEMAAYDALGDLITMAEKSPEYREGPYYAVAALVWARQERDRLRAVIMACADMNQHEQEG